MSSADPAQLLRDILPIQRMERGRLSVMRQGPEGPYYKLQSWENGRNVTRYVPRDQAGPVQEALDGYRRFRERTEQYAQAIIDQTREALAAQSKRKPCRRRPTSSWRRERKSNT